MRKFLFHFYSEKCFSEHCDKIFYSTIECNFQYVQQINDYLLVQRDPLCVTFICKDSNYPAFPYPPFLFVTMPVSVK